jgi:hypothetical protein
MQPLRSYLEGAFRGGLDLPADGIGIVQDTSAVGPAKGRWARPDFILVSAMRFKFLPGRRRAWFRTEDGNRRFGARRSRSLGANKVHPFRSSGLASAGRLQVGNPARRDRGPLRRAWDRLDPHARSFRQAGCEILIDPVRKSTLPMAIEGFLEARLSAAQKDSLARVVRGKS